MSARPVPERCVTPAGAARILCIGVNRVHRLIAEGVIATVPVISTPSRKVIAIAELDRIIAEGVQVSGQPGRPSLRRAS